MSHELFIVAGSAAPSRRRRRRTLIDHAAVHMPGYSTHEVHELEHVVLALVTTEPAGGTVGLSWTGDDGLCLAIAGPSGSVGRVTASGPGSGSENAHLRVTVSHDDAVSVSNDGVAFIASFWAQTEDGFVLATHLASVVSLGVRPVVDEQALMEYMVFLHPLRLRTLLTGVSLLPPGGLLTWSPQRAVTVSSSPLFVPHDATMSDADAVDRFRHLWPTVIADIWDRHADARPVVGLSGGLDSRAIACAAVSLGHAPVTYTYGGTGSHEGRAASSLARRLQLPHLTVPVADERLLHDVDRSIHLLDGAHSPVEMFELWFSDLLRSISDVVVNGLTGGPLWGDDRLVGVTDPSRTTDVVWARYSSAAASVKRVLSRDAAAGMDDVVRTGISASLDEWDFAARPDAGTFWKFANRQLRWERMLVNALRRVGLWLEAPFLDSRFLDFSASVSPRQRENGRLYLQIHREVFSRTADLPRSDDGNSPLHLSHVYWSAGTGMFDQLAGLARQHPVSAARRALRYGNLHLAAELRHRTGIARPADALQQRAAVFPGDVWLRTRPAYRIRLLAMLEAVADPHPTLDLDAAYRALKAPQNSGTSLSAGAIGKAATAAQWIKDYDVRLQDLGRLDH